MHAVERSGSETFDFYSGADQKPLTLEDDNYSHVFAKFPNSFLQNNVHDIQFVEKKYINNQISFKILTHF